jgi:hypothetical protein
MIRATPCSDNPITEMKLRNHVHLIFLILSLLLPTEGLVAGDGDGVVIKKLKLTSPGNGAAGFTLLDNQSLQVGFENKLSQTAWLNNQNLLNGSGVALGEVSFNFLITTPSPSPATRPSVGKRRLKIKKIR